MLLNRRHIRIKVMQTLFAFNGNEGDDFSKDEKFLFHSMDKMYDLYLVLLALLAKIHNKANEKLELSQKKHLATEADRNPNKKFVDNSLLMYISNNQQLKDAINSKKLDYWDLDFEYVDLLYKAITNSSIYKNYMGNEAQDNNEDKFVIIDLYSEVIATNDKLYDYLQDKNITWTDDLPVVNTAITRLFKRFKPSKPEEFLLPNLYKDTDDRVFAKELFNKTLLNRSKFISEISAKTKNWDSERLASLDGILLQMAICEFQKFPSIPVKVTINEYLEIAKEYSTPKSSIFINGILDKITKEYKSQNLHPKIGRGLM